MKRNVLGRVWCCEEVRGSNPVSEYFEEISNPDGTGEGEVLLFLTLPPDSNLILARETFPVTTGEGERLRIERGKAWVGVARVEFVGVAVVALQDRNIK